MPFRSGPMNPLDEVWGHCLKYTFERSCAVETAMGLYHVRCFDVGNFDDRAALMEMKTLTQDIGTTLGNFFNKDNELVQKHGEVPADDRVVRR